MCTMHTCTRKLHAVFLNSRLNLFLPQKRMNTRAAFTASHSRSQPSFLCLRGLLIIPLSAQRSGNFSSIFLWNCVVLLTSVSLIRFKKDSKIMLLMLLFFFFFFYKYLLMLIVLFSSNTLKVSMS
jgi:hypothetical protein